MADSLLRQLMQGLSNAGSSAYDSVSAAGRGMVDDVFQMEDYQVEDGPADLYALQRAMSYPVRVVDRASERAFGSPLLLSSPVEPGVSKNEMDAAATKLLTAQAQAETQAINRRKIEESLLNEQMALLKERSKKAAPSDMYVARGDEVRRGDGSKMGKEGPRKGSLSKVKMQDEGTRAVDKLEKQGLPRELAEAMYALSTAQNTAQADAAKATASMMKPKLNPQQRRAEIIESGLSSKNPQSMQFIRALLRSEGMSEEMIDQLFGKA